MTNSRLIIDTHAFLILDPFADCELKNWKKDDVNIFAKCEGRMYRSKNFPIIKM